jgi:hypothetical protein
MFQPEQESSFTRTLWKSRKTRKNHLEAIVGGGKLSPRGSVWGGISLAGAIRLSLGAGLRDLGLGRIGAGWLFGQGVTLVTRGGYGLKGAGGGEPRVFEGWERRLLGS